MLLYLTAFCILLVTIACSYAMGQSDLPAIYVCAPMFDSHRLEGMCVYVCMYMYVHACVYVYMYVCVYVCTGYVCKHVFVYSSGIMRAGVNAIMGPSGSGKST